MDYEEKIKELTARIEKLEKAENRRVAKRNIKIITKVLVILVVVGFCYFTYVKINNNYIKPYKEKIDYVSDKVDSIENFINDKLGGLQKYFKK